MKYSCDFDFEYLFQKYFNLIVFKKIKFLVNLRKA